MLTLHSFGFENLILDVVLPLLFAGIDTSDTSSDAIAGLGGNYVEGVATVGDRIVLILNLTRVLDTATGVAASSNLVAGFPVSD